MRLVDAHTHAWGADTRELPWQAEIVPPGWEGPYNHNQLIVDMDRVRIDESVVVTTPLYGRGPRANEYTMRAIEAHPDRLWGVGILELFDGDDAAIRDRFAQVVGHDRMLGVRMHACLEYAEFPTDLNPTADWIADERLAPVWEAAAAEDAAIFIFPKASQLATIEELAGRYDDVDIVIDHMAFPDESTDPDEPPWSEFADLAVHENVAVKVSSLARSSAEAWPYADLHGYVTNLVEWFGAERLMLGSDYPWMDSWATFEESLSWVEECASLSRHDRAFLTHRTFERYFE